MRKNAAIGIIFNADKSQVLLVKRMDVPVWVLPGGGIENAESAEQAVVREILEETGLQTKIQRKVATYTPMNHLARDTEVFECSPCGGNLKKGDETKAIGFFSIANLPKDFFFVHGEWLMDALKNDPKTICRPLNSVTYWNLAKYFMKHPWMVCRFLITLCTKK